MIKTRRVIFTTFAIYLLKTQQQRSFKNDNNNERLKSIISASCGTNSEYWMFHHGGRDFLPFYGREKAHKRLVCSQQLDFHDDQTRTSALSINSACVLNYLETLAHTLRHWWEVECLRLHKTCGVVHWGRGIFMRRLLCSMHLCVERRERWSFSSFFQLELTLFQRMRDAKGLEGNNECERALHLTALLQHNDRPQYNNSIFRMRNSEGWFFSQ